MQLVDGTLVGALVLVNALGNVIDPQTQQAIASAQNPLGVDLFSPQAGPAPLSNTTIAVIATNASLSKAAINKVAQMAHDGMAQVIRPAHTMFDGDTIFALALGSATQAKFDPMQVSMLGSAAASTLARAIVKAIRNASSLHGIPAAFQPSPNRDRSGAT